MLILTRAADANSDSGATSSIWRRPDKWPRPDGRTARYRTRSGRRSRSTPRTVRPGRTEDRPWGELCGDRKTPTTLICIRSRDQRWNISRHYRHHRRHLRRSSRGRGCRRVTLWIVPATSDVQTRTKRWPNVGTLCGRPLELCSSRMTLALTFDFFELKIGTQAILPTCETFNILVLRFLVFD